jgi:hypothetical protein
MNRSRIIYVSLLLVIVSCSCAINSNQRNELFNSLSFYASFDESYVADFAMGDPNLYIAPSWDRRAELELFKNDGDNLQIHQGEGRYENALWIDSQYEPVYFYRGEANMPYITENWSGTVSFWMRLDPAEDLHPGYSDPIQITPHGWNDGALFVDFTEEDPRIFRFAIFADRNVWDPEERDWNVVPVEERPMVDVKDLPFSRNVWTHIAFTFRNFNTGLSNGIVDCYINGEKVGILEGHEQTFTWNPEELAIWLGYNYRGYFDELTIFDRELNQEEIQQIYSLENGIRDLLNSMNN